MKLDIWNINYIVLIVTVNERKDQDWGSQQAQDKAYGLTPEVLPNSDQDYTELAR